MPQLAGLRWPLRSEVSSSWQQLPPPLKFVVLHESFLDADLVKAARLGHRFASLHLGLDPAPTLRFYELAGLTDVPYRKDGYVPSGRLGFKGGDHAGLADRGSWSIGVRMDTHQGTKWLAEVAAHELRHLKQRTVNEEDARRYGEWAIDVLVHNRGRSFVSNVHAWSGPVKSLALWGKAEPEDVLIARESGKTTVFRNTAPMGSVRWVEYWPRCPVK